MNVDTDIQVWLETAARVQPSVIVPYVRSAENRTLRYKINAIQDGRNGRTSISQGGTVKVTAHVPRALSSMSMSRSDNAKCEIDLVLSEVGRDDRNYHFDCPELETQPN